MTSDEGAVKPWSLAQVTYENKLFVHTNLGSFLRKNLWNSNRGDNSSAIAIPFA